MNPLGSARRKHKLLAVYFSLLNLPPHIRSTVDHMQLVLLCREKDFTEFGHAKVFSQLVADLKVLEESGITADKTVRGTLYCIAGDNLGSHGIGGFTENFSSSEFFCRYCLMSRSQFQSDCTSVAERTPDNYNSAVEQLQETQEVEGIKFRSVFNSLKHYNVCLPGLPPCLGHDLFEGVLSYDVALYLKYFVKKKRWFTYTHLNRRIKQFQFKSTDASSKPCEVRPIALKLSGHAIQNWNFLRLLPLIIGDRVHEPQDKVWQLALQLKDIVDLTCAQTISRSQIAYLDVLIQEYLDSRKTLFPDNNLRPKHHYLSHYSGLTLKSGPLIKVWTTRFESKHSYFKRCARQSKNFKNLPLTLSDRHQLLQAYLTAGSMGPQDVQMKDCFCSFCSELHTEEINNAVLQFGFTEMNAKVTANVQCKGITYKRGQFLVTGNEDFIQFGELILVIVKDSALHFLVRLHATEFLPHYHMFSVKNLSGRLQCLHINDLLDVWPLSSYIKDGHQVVPLKHSVLRL